MKTLRDIDNSWPPLKEDLEFLRRTKRWTGSQIAGFYKVSRGAVSGMLARYKIPSSRKAASADLPIADDCPTVALDDGAYMEQVHRLKLPPPPNCEIVMKRPRALPVRPESAGPGCSARTCVEGH
ncbi:hypothetical protein [Azospirillum sp.]|uniref:hypothetical protein n=1 Tax=Azospirillum sp. TaxID=34012 RepID=UPI003D759E66